MLLLQCDLKTFECGRLLYIYIAPYGHASEGQRPCQNALMNFEVAGVKVFTLRPPRMCTAANIDLHQKSHCGWGS